MDSLRVVCGEQRDSLRGKHTPTSIDLEESGGSVSSSSELLSLADPVAHFVHKPSASPGRERVVMTTATPTTTSEWQLHKVLLRANLLQYYEIFISQGGDDVQQLCEAGEEEFLEIMALVGMASKPLHVRRLQKALQEWVANPAIFQSSQSSFQPHLSPQNVNSVVPNYSRSTTPVTNNAWTPVTPARNSSPSDQTGSSAVSNQSEMDIKFRSSGSLSPVPTPILTEGQINAIAESAMKLARELPAFEPKSLNPKKPINRDIQTVMCLSEDDPNRMEEIRKYAAIYGRFDSKRKNDKPMSLHEISVNEASAQLCRHIPALLTRREDLFPLARQVVRDSGYQYSKGQSSNPWNGLKRKNSNSTELDFSPLNERAGETLMVKKQKLDPSFQRLDGNQKNATAELDKIQREERMTAINQELLQISQKQEKLKSMASEAKDSGDPETITKIQAEIEAIVQQQMQLLTEQSEIIRRQRRYQMNKVKGVNGNNLDGEDDVTGEAGQTPLLDFSKRVQLPTTITSIANLPHIVEEEEIWMKIEDVIHFVKNLQTAESAIKDIKTFNIIRLFKSFSLGVRERKSHLEISFLSFLRYCFHKYGKFTFCTKVCDDVLSLFTNNGTSTMSISVIDNLATFQNEEMCLKLDEVIKLAKQFQSPYSNREIKSYNIVRLFKTFNEGIYEKASGLEITYLALLKFCFHNLEKFDLCRKVCFEICLKMTEVKLFKSIVDQSAVNLYRIVASTDLVLLEENREHFLECCDSLTPAYFDCIEEFTDEEKKKLIYFEWLFENYLSEESSGMDELTEKWKFLENDLIKLPKLVASMESDFIARMYAASYSNMSMSENPNSIWNSADQDSSNVPSGGSSPQYSHDGEEYDAYTNALQLATGRGPSTESLFDEGLRIAQQYGMADFADSLKELQDMKDDDDDNMEEEENQDDSTSNSVTTEKPLEAMDKPVENGGKSSLSVLLSNESNSKIEPLNGSSEMY